jgi:hypothetical protein
LHSGFSYWTDLFLAAGERWVKFENIPANRFLRPLQWCHTNTNMAVRKSKWHRSITNATECKYEFVHIELVQMFYYIKWISSGTFELEKKQQQTIPKNQSRCT